MKRYRLLLVLLGAMAASPGCAALRSGGPYKEACVRFGESGKNIIEDIPAPTTEGGKARLEAFTDAVEECIRLGKE